MVKTVTQSRGLHLRALEIRAIEAARAAIVGGSALALILADRPLPF